VRRMRTVVREEMLRRRHSRGRTWVSLTSGRRRRSKLLVWRTRPPVVRHLHVLHPHVDLLLVLPGLLPLLLRQGLRSGHVGGPDRRQVKPGHSARVRDCGGWSWLHWTWTWPLYRWRLTPWIHRVLWSWPHHTLTGGITP